MARTIWKFALNLQEVQDVIMPGRSQLLRVGIQRDELQLWALVDPDAPTVSRRILIFGTGWPVQGDCAPAYVGTVEQDVFVWHVLDDGEIE